MASYGTIYKFLCQSHNGWAVEVNIAKKGYAGEIFTRPLGRGPVLRRDNSAGIYGTSMEIYAECRVPGEYAQMYTSAADEYKVSLYRSGQHIWTGFLTPELYSEPDVPVPYDVRLVATDGLGELKRSNFETSGTKTFKSHLEQILSLTGVTRSIVLASALSYNGGADMATPYGVMDIGINLEHENGNTCYDVLQHILTSLHAGITVYNDGWVIFRETDFIRLAEGDNVTVYTKVTSVKYPVASFGSMQSNKWWPIGHMSKTVEPAKNGIELTSPFHYMENMLNGVWTMANNASYDETEGAYILPDADSYISQKLDFAEAPVSYRLALRVRARTVGTAEEDQPLGVRIIIDGVSNAGSGMYWLVPTSDTVQSQRGGAPLAWRKTEGEIEVELDMPADSQNEKDAQDVDIIIPLYYAGARSYVRANDIEVIIFNTLGVHDIYVYDVTLVKHEQADGVQAEAKIDNGAREAASSVDMQMTDGASVPVGGRWSMTGLPFLPSGEVLTMWHLDDDSEYLPLMAKDYAQEIGNTRIRYAGALNVPYGESLPFLFLRDGIYYFPRVYSYNLFEDEMDVELISIPDADVEIS